MADELFQASTSQLSFEKFINTINQEQARDLVRRINQFMKDFNKRAPDSETDAREVQNFLTTMELAFSRHPLWAGSTRTELDNAVEGLEKYLMTKLYDRTFAADPLDRERDAVLSRRLTALAGFVAPAHLEVSAALAGPLAADESGQLAAAERELRRMHLYKSPRDKLVQILNCCKIINTLINSKRAGAGADDFTPTLIYVTIKAQPEALASNLAFIERYRHGPRLNGEASYFFVQMQGAVAFLETLTTSSLAGCDPDEFISHMLAAGAMSEAELSEEQLAIQRQRAAAAVALPPPSRPPPPTQSGGAAAAAVASVPPSAGPGPAAASAAPVYGNPMLSGARQPPPPPPQQQPYVATSGVYGSGTPLPPPPPPPLSMLGQQQPYFIYPSTNAGPPPYNQMVMAPYYGQVPYSVQQGPIMSYGEAWSAAQLQQSGMVAPPPPTPPPPSSTPPPLGSAPAAATGPVTSSPLPPAQPPTVAQSIPPPPKSVAELEADGIRLVVRAEAAGELRARYRYLYTSPEALSLREVSQLLAAYKELVLRYETLAQAVENNVLKYYSELEAYQAGVRSNPPGTTVPAVPATTTAAAPPPPPPLLPHLPPFNAGIRTAPAPPPSLPPAPQHVVSPAKQQPPPPPTHEESELVSKRGTPPPPPPPPPAAPTPQPLLTSGPSGGGAAAAMSPRRTVDLSQFMPDYQLLTEGYALGVMAPPERGTTSTTVAAAADVSSPPPEAAASSAPYHGSSSLMAMNDLLGDEAPPPPPPPPPSPPHVLLDQIAQPASSTTGPAAAAAGTGAAPASPGAAVATTGSATSEAALHGQSWTPQAGVLEPVLSSSTSNGNDSRGPLERDGWQTSQQQQDKADGAGLQHLQQEEQQRQQQHQSQQNIVFLTLSPNSNQLTAPEDVRVSISSTGPGQDGACAATPSGGGGVAAALLAADSPTDDDDRQLTLTLTPPGSSLARSGADLVALASLNNPPAGGGSGEGDEGGGARVEADWGASSAAAAPEEGGPSTTAAAAAVTAGGVLWPFSGAPSTSARHTSEDNESFTTVGGTCLEGTSSATVAVVMPSQPSLSAALAVPMSEKPLVEEATAGAALQDEGGAALLSKSDIGGGVVPTASQTVGHGGEAASSSGQGVGSIHVPAADSHPAGMQCDYYDHTLGVERGAVYVPSSEEADELLTSAAAAAGPVGDSAVAPLVEVQTDLEPQTEAERQARVDELLQQLLGTGGDGVEVSSRGGMIEDMAAYDAASLDATLALYSAGAVGGLAEGMDVGPSDNPLLGDMIDGMTRAAEAASAPPSQEGTTNIVPQGDACEAVGVASTAAAPLEADGGDTADDEQSLFAGLYVQN